MSWAWWSDDLGLHAFTPSSTSISNLHFLSLVLPCSCSFREREGGEKWENGLSWYCFNWGMVHPISCIWHVGPRVELRTAHSPLTACSSDTGGWFGMTSDYPVFSVSWEMGPITGVLALGQLTLFQRSITWSLTIWAIVLHPSDCELPHWVGSNIFVASAVPKNFQGSSRSFIGDRNWELGCSEFGSLQLFPP
jgi:hypothetical protein